MNFIVASQSLNPDLDRSQIRETVTHENPATDSDDIELFRLNSGYISE